MGGATTGCTAMCGCGQVAKFRDDGSSDSSEMTDLGCSDSSSEALCTGELIVIDEYIGLHEGLRRRHADLMNVIKARDDFMAAAMTAQAEVSVHVGLNTWAEICGLEKDLAAVEA